MINRVSLMVVATVASVLGAGAAMAQAKPGAKGEVGLAYSFMRLDGASASVGAGIDASRIIATSANNVEILLVGDASINRFGANATFEAATQAQVTGGLRFAGSMSGGAAPFAQVLAGVVSCCGETSPAVMVGVGVSTPIGKGTPRFRVQADFPTVFYKAGTSDTGPYAAYRKTGVRVNAGVAIPIGR